MSQSPLLGRPPAYASSAPASGVIISDTGGYYTADDLESILAEIGAGSAPGSFLTVIGGGKGTVQALGNLGATELLDLANANLFWGTLNANCTITTTGWTNLKDCQITVILFEDGTGGWTPTFSGITWDGGGAVPTHDTTAGTWTRYVFTSHDGGTTIEGAQTGGGRALTVEDDGTPLAGFAERMDFVGAGVTATGTGVEKTITIPGATAAQVVGLVAAGGHVHVDNVTFSGDGTTTAFTLPAAPVDEFSVAAYVVGVRTAVTLSGALLDTMTFGSAPAAGTDNIVVDIAAVIV